MNTGKRGNLRFASATLENAKSRGISINAEVIQIVSDLREQKSKQGFFYRISESFAKKSDDKN